MGMTTESKRMTTAQRMAHYAFKRPTPTAMATYFYLLGVLAAFLAAGVLVAAEAKTKVEPTKSSRAGGQANVDVPIRISLRRDQGSGA